MIFKSTSEALEVGRTLTSPQAKKLLENRGKLLAISHLLMQEKQINWSIEALNQAKFQKEAMESFERKGL